MRFLIVVLTVMIPSHSIFGQEAVSGYRVLKTHCFSCHADEFQVPGFDLRDREGLIVARKDGVPYLVPGEAEASLVWQVIRDGRMPPEGHDRGPNAAEGELLRRWIELGAPFPHSERTPRKFAGERTATDLVQRDLQQRPEATRESIRYFSLMHLWNSQLDEENLRIVRAAVSKLINSLSNQPRIVAPQPVDEDGLILRIDLRDYGWTDDAQWRELLKSYPYALSTDDDQAKGLQEMTGSELAVLRADWFVFHAARPPLYHQLLRFPGAPRGLPVQVKELEDLLGVDRRENIESGRVVRAGLSGENSGPSDHHRIGERHTSTFGYYWFTYDTGGDTDRRNFFRFPLGPAFVGAANLKAFEHDGGELIFSLPNGLQGYLLIKSDGTRIDEGPPEIVKDPNQFSGSQVIVNGISCMGCHRRGIIPFQDAIRGLYAEDRSKIGDRVRQLYPPQNEIEQEFVKDKAKYEKSLHEAIRPFMEQKPSYENSPSDWVEPIQSAARRYAQPLKLPDIARELGLPKEEAVAEEFGIKATEAELKTAIKFSSVLRGLQLEPLVKQESITRTHWESAFQKTARELGLGTPLEIADDIPRERNR